MSASRQEEIDNFRNSYTEMFGEVPPLPKAKFEFSSDIDPEALLLVEKLRPPPQAGACRLPTCGQVLCALPNL